MNRTAASLAFVGAVLCAPVGPAAAQVTVPPIPPASAGAPPSQTAQSETEKLQAERTRLMQESPRNQKRIDQIDARLAEIAAQQARAASETGGVATKTTITNQQLEQTNAQNTYEAIKNVPGVTQADSSAPGSSDNIQIRGIKLASTTGYRLDGGLPIVNNLILQTEDKAQIQVLKGAGALEYGLASPAGIVNYVLKRAGPTPVGTLQFATNQYGQGIVALDIGRRFGYDNRWAYRINLAGGQTGSFIAAGGGTRYLAAITADYTTPKYRFRADVEQYGVNIVEQATLLINKPVNNYIALPRVPNPSELLSGPWDRTSANGNNFSLRYDYNIDDGWGITAEVGHAESRRSHRETLQIGTINIDSGLGTGTFSLVRDQDTINTYENINSHWRLTIGNGDALTNIFTVGATRNTRDAGNPVASKATVMQNIYNPILLPAPTLPTGPITYQPQSSVDYDYFFTESAVIVNKIHLNGGVRQINYNAYDLLTTGTTYTNRAFLAPAVGVTIDLGRVFTAYSSYVKSLEESPTAPINSVNALALLPPAPATQKEVGFRAIVPKSYTAQLAYFYIDRANATLDPTTNIFALNGTNNFQGLESSETFEIGKRSSLSIGGQYEHAIQHSDGDPTINGKFPENVPRLSGNIGYTYRPPSIAGLAFSVGALSVASREINPQDQGNLPAITTYSTALAYTGRFNGKPMTMNLSVRNLTDRHYYSSIVSGALTVSAPRTISFNTKFTP